MAGIPLKRFLFRRNLEIPGVEEAAPPGLPPPQEVDTSFLNLGQPAAPEDPGAIEGGEVAPQIAQPSGLPTTPPAAPPPMMSPAVKTAFQKPQLQGLPPAPTFEPLPQFQGPKGLRQILMYAIPNYAQGKQARFEHEKEAAKYANTLKIQAYNEQMAAAREARMQEMGIGNLQQRFENFQETVRNHLEREGISKQANDLRKNAELNKLSQRAMWIAGYYGNRTDVSEEEKQIGIRKFLGLGTTTQLNYSTLLDMAGGDPAMIEALPDEVKKMFGALPPAGPAGAQPSTTYGWVGPDIQGNYKWGIQSQRVPGMGPGAPSGQPPALPPAPTGLPPAPPQKVHPSRLPTAASRQMSETASVIVPKINTLLHELEDPKLKAKLGVALSRWNEFMAGKVGAGDPDFARLRTTMGLITTGAMRAHVGARGGAGMLEHFKSMADASKMDEPTLRASLTAMRDFLSGYILDFGNEPSNAPQRETRIKTINGVDYTYEKLDDGQWHLKK